MERISLKEWLKELIEERLKGMSTRQLRELALQIRALVQDLEKEEPSYALALEEGIRCTTRYPRGYPGGLQEYSGEVIIMANGFRWRAVGHGRERDANGFWQNGFIEFFPLFPLEEGSPPEEDSPLEKDSDPA